MDEGECSAKVIDEAGRVQPRRARKESPQLRCLRTQRPMVRSFPFCLAPSLVLPALSFLRPFVLLNFLLSYYCFTSLNGAQLLSKLSIEFGAFKAATPRLALVNTSQLNPSDFQRFSCQYCW